MAQYNCTTKYRFLNTLNVYKRGQIAALRKEGRNIWYIAKQRKRKIIPTLTKTSFCGYKLHNQNKKKSLNFKLFDTLTDKVSNSKLAIIKVSQ